MNMPLNLIGIALAGGVCVAGFGCRQCGQETVIVGCIGIKVFAKYYQPDLD